MKSLSKFSVRSCDELCDITALAEVQGLENARVEECKKVAKGPGLWPSKLKSLSLENTSLKEIGSCPAALAEISIRQNPKLLTLKGLTSCKDIEISSWGLDLSGCFSLKNLDGLSVKNLEEILIPETLSNLDALAAYPNVKITVVAGNGKEKGYTSVVDDIPEAIGMALAKIKVTELNVRTEWGSELKKITGIGLATTLTSLDLSGCNLADITAIAPLENLEMLKVQPRTELSKKLGKATFDSKGQIDKLRLKLLAGI